MTDGPSLLESEKIRTSHVIVAATVNGEVNALMYVLSCINKSKETPRPYTLPQQAIPSEVSKSFLNQDEEQTRTLLSSWLSGFFNPEEYSNAVLAVQAAWKPIEEKYFSSCRLIKDIVIPPIINAGIVRYGVGGGYYPTRNEVSVWWNGDKTTPLFKRKDPSHIVGHEIMHLLLHNFVKTAQLPYWKKERLIDLVLVASPFAQILPGYIPTKFGDKSIDDKFSWDSLKTNPQEHILSLV